MGLSDFIAKQAELYQKENREIKVIPPVNKEEKLDLFIEDKPDEIVVIEEKRKKPLFINRNSSQEVKTEKVKIDVQVKTVEEKAETPEDLFVRSETDISRKKAWFEVYERAQKSRKSNPVSERVKSGHFMIAADGSVVVLPNIDTYGKSSSDILKMDWLPKKGE